MEQPLQPPPDDSIRSQDKNNGRLILIIEDEHFISELYERALVKAGYQVKSIGDGASALKEAQTNNYDIILLDLMIPNITGIEILRTLKTQQPPIKAKIIITTNLEQRQDVRAEIEKQADAYVVKAELTPHELVDFLSTIK